LVDDIIVLALFTATFFRGKAFRTDFLRIGEIRSLLPPATGVLALTATAKASTRRTVIKSLNMQCCHIVCRIPNRTNIKYSMFPKPDDAMTVFSPMLTRLCQKGIDSERCIVFCRTYEDVKNLFEKAVLYLYDQNALFVGDPDLPRTKRRVCDKYDARTAPNIQRSIIESFTHPNGSLRLIFATVAFAMGLDAPNVREVVHWGPPDDIEMYVQETGRAGRDGASASATLYYNNRDISNAITCHTSPDMKAYCQNGSECRRKFLMSVFVEDAKAIELPLHSHECCDVCESSCSCSKCSTSPDDTLIPLDQFLDDSIVLPLEPLMEMAKQRELKTRMKQLSHEICYQTSSSHDYLLVGPTVCTGLSDATIKRIICECRSIEHEDDLLTLGVTSRMYCSQILEVLQDFK
jgi:ATP-dependent DNA helicase RecQ